MPMKKMFTDLNRKLLTCAAICFCVLIGASDAFAQLQISGSIKDSDGNPLVGANVVEKGTTNGVTADLIDQSVTV